MNLGSIIESSQALQQTECKIYFNIFYKWMIVTQKNDRVSCIILSAVIKTILCVYGKIKPGGGWNALLLK